MKKIFVVLLTFIGFTSMVFSEGPLKMKGFHRTMSFEDGCQNLKNLLPNEEIIIQDAVSLMGTKIGKKCGINYRGHVSWVRVRIETYGSGQVQSIFIFRDDTDRIFNTKNMKPDEFAQNFVNAYDWIDGLDYETEYTKEGRAITEYKKRSTNYGWEIKIKSKFITIHFFEPVRPSFTEGAEPNTKEKILDIAQRWSQGERATLQTPTNTRPFESTDLGTSCEELSRVGAGYPGGDSYETFLKKKRDVKKAYFMRYSNCKGTPDEISDEDFTKYSPGIINAVNISREEWEKDYKID